MALTRWAKIGLVVIGVAALGSAIVMIDYQRDELIKQQQALEQTKLEFSKAQASLAEASDAAQQQANKLDDAVKQSEQYQQEQRVLARNSQRIVNGLMAAASVKTAMTECFLTEGHWPNSNAECGINQPASFANTEGLSSISVVPNGRIRIEYVDTAKKKEVLWLTAVTNSAMQVTWSCTTQDIADISNLVPTCRFKAN